MTVDASADSLVYADMQSLVRLQFKAFGFSFLPRQPISSLLAGKHGSRLRGRGLDFEELRHYRPGDDIRTLDWKVTNRTGKPHVRCYHEERERQALLLVDQRVAMFFGSRVRMKSVVAAELASLAAWRVFAVGDRIGALVFNDREIAEVKPHRSRKTVLRILERLTHMNRGLRAGQADPQNAPMLNRALREAERLSKHDCVVLLVSDLNGWNDETVKRVKRLARHNDVIVALVFDPLEKELPDAGDLVVSDGAMQIQLDLRKPRLKSDFERGFRSSVEYLQGELQKHAVPVIPVDTVSPVDEQLREAIGDALRQRRP